QWANRSLLKRRLRSSARRKNWASSSTARATWRPVGSDSTGAARRKKSPEASARQSCEAICCGFRSGASSKPMPPGQALFDRPGRLQRGLLRQPRLQRVEDRAEHLLAFDRLQFAVVVAVVLKLNFKIRQQDAVSLDAASKS